MECTIVRDDMLDVLYGAADRATVKRVEEHCAACAECGEELAAFRDVRSQMASWKLPAPRHATRVRRPPARFSWGLAAAAAVLLACGAALGALGAGNRYARMLEEQAAHHEQDMRTVRASLASAAPSDSEALLGKVRDMIHESEAREAERLNASMSEFGERTAAQRRYDLARVSAGLSYLDGKNGQAVARTTELMGYMLQAAQKR
jgi:hypothetical protein